MGNLAGTVVDSGVSLEDGIVTDMKALLREAAEDIRASVEAAAESMVLCVTQIEAKLAAAEAEIATLRDTLVLIDNRCYQDEWVVRTIAAAMGGKDEKAK